MFRQMALVCAAGILMTAAACSFKLGNNGFPIQDFYMFEVVKAADRYTYKTLAKTLPNTQDAYHPQCQMK